MSATAVKAAPLSPAEALAEADAKLTDAEQAMTSAAEAAHSARHAVTAAEAAVVDAIAAGAPTATLKAARTALDTARAAAEWADIERQAAEVRYSRQADQTAAARRAVVAEEYTRVHAAYNREDNREAVLLAQLTATVVELCRIIPARQEQHDRLACEVASWPADERPVLLGKPIATYGHRGLGVWPVELPHAELAEAIKAGVDSSSGG